LDFQRLIQLRIFDEDPLRLYESRQGCKSGFRVVLVVVVPVEMCVSALGAVHLSTGRPAQLAAGSAVGSVGTSCFSLASDSALKERRQTCHSSCCSARTAPTNRTTARSFGKIPTTSVRRLT